MMFKYTPDEKYDEAVRKIAAAKIKKEKSFDLYHLGLKSLPEELFEMDWIEQLHLGGNALTELPDAITKLKNLNWLFFYNNRFTEFPSILCSLTSLKDLNLADNFISSIPPQISNLQNLESLKFGEIAGGNRIVKLPSQIGKLSNLRELEIGNNLLTNLPKSMENLVNLDRLFLNNNKFEKIPEVIFKLPNLTTLSLAKNKISKLPQKITELNIEWINLEGNFELDLMLKELLNNYDKPELIFQAYFNGLPAPAKIFISYARADQTIVKALRNYIFDHGYKTWMDLYDIKGGEQWLRSINKAIEDSDMFIAVLSNNSVSRRGVIQKELKKALDKWEGMLPDDIYILPIRIDDCPIPELLKDIQVLDWNDGKGGKKLLEAIKVGLTRRKNE